MMKHPLLRTSPGLSGVDLDLGSRLKTKRDRAFAGVHSCSFFYQFLIELVLFSHLSENASK